MWCASREGGARGSPCVRTQIVAATSEEFLEPDPVHPPDLAQRHPHVRLHQVLGVRGQQLAQREGIVEVAARG